jgi:hypothetical protein
VTQAQEGRATILIQCTPGIVPGAGMANALLSLDGTSGQRLENYMAKLPDDEKFDEIRKKLLEEIAKNNSFPPTFFGLDWGKKEGGETVYRRIHWKEEVVIPRHHEVHVNWKDDEIILTCPKCKGDIHLHKDGKCPTIIDGNFVEDQPPLLPSGKE